MSSLPHIKFTVRQSALDTEGMYRTATVRNVEVSGISDTARKYVPDIIMHALTHSKGVSAGDDMFTYTFPFRLS